MNTLLFFFFPPHCQCFGAPAFERMQWRAAGWLLWQVLSTPLSNWLGGSERLANLFYLIRSITMHQLPLS
jgi:hypothetical protein